MSATVGTRRSAAELLAGGIVLVIALAFLVYAVANTGRVSVGGTVLTAKFDNVGSIGPGTDVRIAGVKVGSVSGVAIDPKTYQAVLTLTVQPDIKLPKDSSAVISSGGLLGGGYLNITPGGDEAMLASGQAITITQSAVNLEDLLGKFIFNVGNLADATQKSLQQHGATGDGLAPAPGGLPK